MEFHNLSQLEVISNSRCFRKDTITHSRRHFEWSPKSFGTVSRSNSEVRKVIHQAALSVRRNYSHYHEYYNQKKAEGKDHLLIINNIINKLIKMYCAMWNRREEYDLDHIRKLKKKFGKSSAKA